MRQGFAITYISMEATAEVSTFDVSSIRMQTPNFNKIGISTFYKFSI